MRDKDRTREQFINELAEARQRIAELETLETGHKRAGEALQRSVTELENLQHITEALLSQEELPQVMNTVAEGIVTRLGYDMALVSRYVEEESVFTGLALYPIPMSTQFDRFLKLIGRTDLKGEPTQFKVPYRRGENPLVDRFHRDARGTGAHVGHGEDVRHRDGHPGG